MEMSYADLKKREKQWLNQFHSLPVIVNQYHTYINDKFRFFRIYEIKTDPKVETDSYEVFREAMRSMPEAIKKSLGVSYFCRRGSAIWHLFQTQLTADEEKQRKSKPFSYAIRIASEFEYMITLKYVKQSNIHCKQNESLILQFLNIKLKHVVLEKCKMKQLYPNTFYPQWGSYFKDNRLQVEAKIGFKFNLQYLEIQLFCDINNRLRQMNKKSFLEDLQLKKQKPEFYIGKRVSKNYGNQKTYLIKNIVFNMNPTSYFIKNQEKMTYLKYFEVSYQLKINDLKQPMIETSDRFTHRINKKGNQIQKVENKIYLVPELVSLTEIPEQAKIIMKKQLQITPNQCIAVAADFIKEVNKNQKDFQIYAQNRRGFAHLIHDPEIQINKFTRIVPFEGSFRIQTQINEPIDMLDVLIVYSVGQDKKYDREQIDQAIKILNKSGERYKIKIKEHFCLEISKSRNSEDWISEVQKDSKKNGEPFFAIFALQDDEEDIYPILKEELTYRLKIATQMFKRSKINKNQKGSLKIAGNIIKQIAAKKNQSLWTMRQIPHYEQKFVLILGISVQKIGNKFELVICRNFNKEISKFKTKQFELQNKQISKQILEQQFYNQLEDYIKFEKKKVRPSTIIVYRMGLNNQKFVSQHVNAEYDMLKGRVQYVYKMKLKSQYTPELLYIQVIDRPSQKIWIQNQGNQPGSILPKVSNPPVGTVMRGQNDEEFYLVPYKTRSGTVYPTLYKVLKNESKVAIEFIVEFTYAQCYMYYNWQGSIRIPQVLQLCKKLHQSVKPRNQCKSMIFEGPSFM